MSQDRANHKEMQRALEEEEEERALEEEGRALELEERALKEEERTLEEEERAFEEMGRVLKKEKERRRLHRANHEEMRQQLQQMNFVVSLKGLI